MTKKKLNKKRLYVKHLMNTKEFMRDTGRLSIWLKVLAKTSQQWS